MSNEDRPALLVLPDRIRINRRGWFLVVAAVIIALLPFVIQDSYWRTNLIVCAINVMLAIGLDFILGYAGQLNLGHSAFYGIGAYASTLLIMRLGVPFWMAFVFGMVLSGAAGMALSIFAVRLRGHYLAIASLGFAVIVHQVLLNWISLTQGPLGIYVRHQLHGLEGVRLRRRLGARRRGWRLLCELRRHVGSGRLYHHRVLHHPRHGHCRRHGDADRPGLGRDPADDLARALARSRRSASRPLWRCAHPRRAVHARRHRASSAALPRAV